jgi:glycosyltransferase involved in cell wall biosynthesis
MQVSVIVPVKIETIAQLRQFQACVDRLLRQTFWEFEIIVVDDGSGLAARVAEICWRSGVRYFWQENRGSAAARNVGIVHAKGAIVAFTDADCLPALDWLETGVANLIWLGNGIVAGEIEMTWRGIRPTAIEWADRVTHLRQDWYAELGYAATANMLTWRENFERVGLFRELPRLGDREWGQRSGLPVVHAGNCIVVHPARHTLRDLFGKVWAQAQVKGQLDAWTGQEVLRMLWPIGWRFWRTALGDRTLPLWERVRFIAIVLGIRWMNGGAIIFERGALIVLGSRDDFNKKSAKPNTVKPAQI